MHNLIPIGNQAKTTALLAGRGQTTLCMMDGTVLLVLRLGLLERFDWLGCWGLMLDYFKSFLTNKSTFS
jgi:hypothetical protein